MTDKQLEVLAQVGKRPWDDWDAGLIWRVMEERKKLLDGVRDLMAALTVRPTSIMNSGTAQQVEAHEAVNRLVVARGYAEEGAF